MKEENEVYDSFVDIKKNGIGFGGVAQDINSQSLSFTRQHHKRDDSGEGYETVMLTLAGQSMVGNEDFIKENHFNSSNEVW